MPRDPLILFLGVGQAEAPTNPGILPAWQQGWEIGLSQFLDPFVTDPAWAIRRVFVNEPFGVWRGVVKNEGGLPTGRAIAPDEAVMTIDAAILCADTGLGRFALSDFESAWRKRIAASNLEVIFYFGNTWRLIEQHLTGAGFLRRALASVALALRVGGRIAIDSTSSTLPGSDDELVLQTLRDMGARPLVESWPNVGSPIARQLDWVAAEETYQQFNGKPDRAPKKQLAGECIRLAIHPTPWGTPNSRADYVASTAKTILSDGDSVAAPLNWCADAGMTRKYLTR